MMQPYQKLIVWQKAMDLCFLTYDATDNYPKYELFALTDQTRRAVVSIPSNIAEGNQRHTRKENLHFLAISYGSCAELNTQLLIALHRKYIDQSCFDKISSIRTEVEKMLNAMIYRSGPLIA